MDRSAVDLSDTDPSFRTLIDLTLGFNICSNRSGTDLFAPGTVGNSIAMQAAAVEQNGKAFELNGSRVMKNTDTALA